MVSRFAGWFSRRGLQVQFIVITMCATIAVMSVLGYLAVHREKSLLYEEVEKQGRLLGETLAIPLIPALIYANPGLLEGGGGARPAGSRSACIRAEGSPAPSPRWRTRSRKRTGTSST